MAGPGWKGRFTEEKLAQKRMLDRIGQRRQRQNTKEVIAKLNERLQTLLAGDDRAFARELIEENTRLRAALRACQAKLEDITLSSARCLDSVFGTESTLKHVENNVETSGQEEKHDILTQVVELPYIGNESAYSQATHLNWTLQGCPPKRNSRQNVVEALMQWKLAEGHGFGSAFLVDLFKIDQSPTFLNGDELSKRIRCSHFYDEVIGSLETGLQPNFSLDPVPEGAMSGSEFHNRAVVLCAYSLVACWFRYLYSKWERYCAFWGTYSVFKLWTFPSSANLELLPPYLRPSPSQLTCEHPAFLDCLPWPTLRNSLIAHCKYQDIPETFRDICLHYRLSPHLPNLTMPLFLDQSSSSLVLSDDFREALFDLSNLRFERAFLDKHCDLASCLVQEQESSKMQCIANAIPTNVSFANLVQSDMDRVFTIFPNDNAFSEFVALDGETIAPQFPETHRTETLLPILRDENAMTAVVTKSIPSSGQRVGRQAYMDFTTHGCIEYSLVDKSCLVMAS